MMATDASPPRPYPMLRSSRISRKSVLPVHPFSSTKSDSRKKLGHRAVVPKMAATRVSPPGVKASPPGTTPPSTSSGSGSLTTATIPKAANRISIMVVIRYSMRRYCNSPMAAASRPVKTAIGIQPTETPATLSSRIWVPSPTAAVSSSPHSTHPTEINPSRAVAPVRPSLRRANWPNESPKMPTRALMSCAMMPMSTASTTSQMSEYPNCTPALLMINTDPEPK